MRPEIEQALRTAATEARIVDPDLVTLPVFEKILSRVASEKDATRAVAEMAAARPALFKKDDYAKMSSTEFDSAEARLRERLSRRAQPVRNNAFATLDAALLNDGELAALKRYLGGARNSTYDESILRAALTRQTGPRGDAA